MKFRLRVLLAAILLAFLCVCTAGADIDDEGTQEIKQTLLEALNELRKSYQVGELKTDEQLSVMAQRQAEYLAEIGKLEKYGPNGEGLEERAQDAGYGGERSFTISETNAKVWVDTDLNYLINDVLRRDQYSIQVMFNKKVRQIGIGIADAPDKHRYYVLTLAGMDDGNDEYTPLPTYDYRTPKPTTSPTPTPPPLVTSTMNPDGSVFHEVGEGETFFEIAYAYDVDWYTLSILNNIPLSDTTPVVIFEGESLVIRPSYTPTFTPTATKTPVPPTVTPRPTFTGAPETLSTPEEQHLDRLPAPQWGSLILQLEQHKRTVGWILIGISVPGLILVLRKRK